LGLSIYIYPLSDLCALGAFVDRSYPCERLEQGRYALLSLMRWTVISGATLSLPRGLLHFPLDLACLAPPQLLEDGFSAGTDA